MRPQTNDNVPAQSFLLIVATTHHDNGSMTIIIITNPTLTVGLIHRRGNMTGWAENTRAITTAAIDLDSTVTPPPSAPPPQAAAAAATTKILPTEDLLDTSFLLTIPFTTTTVIVLLTAKLMADNSLAHTALMAMVVRSAIRFDHNPPQSLDDRSLHLERMDTTGRCRIMLGQIMYSGRTVISEVRTVHRLRSRSSTAVLSRLLINL
jgi:hypothetical protein